MAILDIILLLSLLWALYTGFKEGVVVQLGGLAGLFIGVYLAFRFGPPIGKWLGLDPSVSGIAGFIIVVIAVIILLAIVSRIIRKILGAAGLGMLDKAGGVVLSVVKMGLILGLLLYGFDSLNKNGGWVAGSKLEESKLYRPLVTTVTYVFPYVDTVKDKLLPPRETDGPGNDYGDEPGTVNI